MSRGGQSWYYFVRLQSQLLQRHVIQFYQNYKKSKGQQVKTCGIEKVKMFGLKRGRRGGDWVNKKRTLQTVLLIIVPILVHILENIYNYKANSKDRRRRGGRVGSF